MKHSGIAATIIHKYNLIVISATRKCTNTNTRHTIPNDYTRQTTASTERTNTNTRYTNNVTVKDCTFAGENEALVAIKSYTGGDRNLQVIGCTVYAGMHSLLQVDNVEQGLKVEGCEVYSKNGINLNNTPSLEMDGCTFDVKGYAVRVGEGSVVNETEKFYNIFNSKLTSTCDADDDAVIVFRASARYATLNLAGTTLAGTPKFLGAEEGTTTIIR